MRKVTRKVAKTVSVTTSAGGELNHTWDFQPEDASFFDELMNSTFYDLYRTKSAKIIWSPMNPTDEGLALLRAEWTDEAAGQSAAGSGGLDMTKMLHQGAKIRPVCKEQTLTLKNPNKEFQDVDDEVQASSDEEDPNRVRVELYGPGSGYGASNLLGYLTIVWDVELTIHKSFT